MGCTKGIIHINLSQRCQLLYKLRLTSFAIALTLLFRVETKVLKEQHLTILQLLSLLQNSIAHTILSHLHLSTKELLQVSAELRETQLLIHPLRTTHMATDNEATTPLYNLTKRRQSPTHTRIISDLSRLI